MSGSQRPSGRAADALRQVRLTREFTKHPAGSVLVEFGDTRVLCTATVEDQVPRFLRGSRRGWITAEYGMLPGATHTRADREAVRGKQGGRTVEIQRLIGRSLRAAVDLRRLGERTIKLDCDVIQADGGTRTASITRRLRGAGGCRGQGGTEGLSRLRGVGFGWRVQGRVRARPRLQRGFQRRHRHERV